MIKNYYVLSPAYGRDYNTASEALKAFEDGKDFVCRGRYCSVKDFKDAMVEIRFNNSKEV